MPQKFFGRDAEVVVFLEAVAKEVFDDWGGAFGNGRTIVLNDAIEGWHGFEEVIWRTAFKKFDDSTSDAPK